MKSTIALLMLFLPVVASGEPADDVRCREVGFSRAAESRDAAEFAAFIDPDARFVGSTVNRGVHEIVAAWSVFFEPDGPFIKWRPQFVEVLESGDLALSRGPYRLQMHDENGDLVKRWGTFNSVWRRDPGGDWKVVFDAGSNPDESPDDDVRALLDTDFNCDQEMGWTMGLEPTTTGITTRGSTN